MVLESAEIVDGLAQRHHLVVFLQALHDSTPELMFPHAIHGDNNVGAYYNRYCFQRTLKTRCVRTMVVRVILGTGENDVTDPSLSVG
jgi:hypothetical protein